MRKERGRGLCALFLALLCMAGVLGQALAASSQNTYFTAVNDSVLELRDETMPFYSNGDLYVPYTVFDPNITGIQLGVFVSYGNNVVVLYSRKTGALIFDLTQDTAISSTGAKYTKRAIRHNSTIFVPVDLVSTYFGLSWSIQVDRDYGWVVRIMSASAQIPDGEFLTKGRYILESRYNAYLRRKGLLSAPSPLPLPSPSPAPAPSPAPLPGPVYLPTFPPVAAQPSPSQPQPSPSLDQPGPSSAQPGASSAQPSQTPAQSSDPQPAPVQSEPPQPQGGAVYVGVRCTPGGDSAAVAAALHQQEAQGVFFFPPEALAGRDSEVRALAAAGHKIGLLLDGETPEQCREQWEQGGRLLAHILRARTDMVMTAADAGIPRGALAWTATADGTEGVRTSSQQMSETLKDAVQPEDCFLLLDDGAQTASLASRLLNRMAEEGCTFRLSLEPMLAEQNEK